MRENDKLDTKLYDGNRVERTINVHVCCYTSAQLSDLFMLLQRRSPLKLSHIKRVRQTFHFRASYLAWSPCRLLSMSLSIESTEKTVTLVAIDARACPRSRQGREQPFMLSAPRKCHHLSSVDPRKFSLDVDRADLLRSEACLSKTSAFVTCVCEHDRL